MTRHVIEALFVGLIFLALVPLATRRDHVVIAAAVAGVAFFIGLILVASNST